MNRHALYLAWLIALISTLGSIYYGEVMGVEPCRLCWYQRICMFPLALFLGIATMKGDRDLALYCFPLVTIGAVIAFYHSIIQIAPQVHVEALCGHSNYCTLAGPLPFFSTLAFVAIGILILFSKKQ